MKLHSTLNEVFEVLLAKIYQIGGNIKRHVNPIWYGLFLTALCVGGQIWLP